MKVKLTDGREVTIHTDKLLWKHKKAFFSIMGKVTKGDPEAIGKMTEMEENLLKEVTDIGNIEELPLVEIDKVIQEIYKSLTGANREDFTKGSKD